MKRSLRGLVFLPNGQVLGADLGNPDIYSIDPSNGEVLLVASYEKERFLWGGLARIPGSHSSTKILANADTSFHEGTNFNTLEPNFEFSSLLILDLENESFEMAPHIPSLSL